VANPNITSTTTLVAGNGGFAPTTTKQDFLTNAASSGKLIKVVGLLISNIDGTVAADITIGRRDTSNDEWSLLTSVEVPAKFSLEAISPENPKFLLEDEQLYCQASANGDLQITFEYEEYS